MTNTSAILSRFALSAAFTMLPMQSALPGPGAHGPNGEHLEQAGARSATRGVQPRFEAATDTFELVAVLGGGELSLLIDHFDSNAPVLGAKVEVDVAGRKAQAKFHSDHGDYAIDDPALIAALSKPGEHAVVISVVAGESSDLLNGTLVVADPGARPAATAHAHDDHGHERELERAALIGAGVAGLAALVLIVRVRRRRRRGDGASVTEAAR